MKYGTKYIAVFKIKKLYSTPLMYVKMSKLLLFENINK